MINEITQGIKREIVAVSIREHLLKKMFSFGHCPNEGGGAPARIKKYNIYIYI